VRGTAALGGIIEQVEQAAQFAVPADQPLTRYPQHIAIIAALTCKGDMDSNCQSRPTQVDVATEG